MRMFIYAFQGNIVKIAYYMNKYNKLKLFSDDYSWENSLNPNFCASQFSYYHFMY